MPVPILLMARALDLGGSERQLAEIARSLDPATCVTGRFRSFR
jgi:hypothetical protein